MLTLCCHAGHGVHAGVQLRGTEDFADNCGGSNPKTCDGTRTSAGHPLWFHWSGLSLDWPFFTTCSVCRRCVHHVRAARAVCAVSVQSACAVRVFSMCVQHVQCVLSVCSQCVQSGCAAIMAYVCVRSSSLLLGTSLC